VKNKTSNGSLFRRSTLNYFTRENLEMHNRKQSVIVVKSSGKEQRKAKIIGGIRKFTDK